VLGVEGCFCQEDGKRIRNWNGVFMGLADLTKENNKWILSSSILARMMLKQLTSKAVVLDVEKYGCHDKMLHCLLKKLGNNSKCDYDISSVTKNNVAN
jgi:hypothetical protein